MQFNDCAVVGLGVMGASTLWRLAGRGAKVIGFDSYPLLHLNGSSHGHTRVIRKAYFEHQGYVPLLERAYALWLELQKGRSLPIINLCGVIYVSGAEGEVIQGTRLAADIHSIPLQIFSWQEINRRFPVFQAENHESGLLEPNAGFLHAENAVKLLTELARANGAKILRNKIVDMDLGANPKRLVTASGEVFWANSVILCQGGWAQDLLAELGVRLTVTRQTVGWFGSQSGPNLNLGSFPAYAVEREGFFVYGIPSGAGEDLNGIKVACHNLGPEIGPDDNQPDLTSSEINDLCAKAKLALPGAELTLRKSISCKYSNSPDGNFIIDHHPRYENVYFAAGFSGHGFKFGPVVGEVLADFAQFGKTTHEIDFLSLQRFG